MPRSATHPPTPDGAAASSPQVTTGPLPAAARAGPLSHTIFRVARLHRMTAGQLLRRAGLHPGQELLMMHLWDTGPQRQVDLIRVLDSDAATMTRSIRRLEQAGFVRRRPDPIDRRATIVEPTAASQALRDQVEQIWHQLEQLTVGDFSTAEQTAAAALLDRIEHNLLRAGNTTEHGDGGA